MLKSLVYLTSSLGLIWASYVKSPCIAVEREIAKRFIKNPEEKIAHQSEGGELGNKDKTFATKEVAKGEEEFQVSIKGVVLDKVSQAPVVILITKDEMRFIPIWVGFSEAQAIDMEIKGIIPPRPMTHDLLKNIIDILGGKVEKVVITDIKNNTYYAEIVINDGNRSFQVDSRPSDAIALALRTKVPVFVSRNVLEASIKVPEPQKEELILEKVGILIQEITPELEEFFKTKGVVVSDIKSNSPADGKLQRGDVIISINGKSVQSKEGIKIILEEIIKSNELNFSVVRNGKINEIKIKSK